MFNFDYVGNATFVSFQPKCCNTKLFEETIRRLKVAVKKVRAVDGWKTAKGTVMCGSGVGTNPYYYSDVEVKIKAM